jgi:hypothetical protein
MALFEGYSTDELNRVLSYSRWALGVLAVLTATAGVFNQWIADRIATLQRVEKATAQERTKAAQAELELTKQKTAELERRLGPWSFSDGQRALLLQALASAPKGRVALEYIQSDERRSHAFADVLAAAFRQAGYDVWGYIAPLIQAGASPLVGVQIVVMDSTSEAVGMPILRALEGAEIPVRLARRSNQNYDSDVVVIWIGIKP